MPSPFLKKHWNIFSKIPHVSAGAGGAIPVTWAKRHGITATPKGLPNYLLDRKQVRDICQNPDIPVLFAYLCVMAWGNQGGAGRGSQHVQSAWAEKTKLKKHLSLLRAGDLTRSDAYSLFTGTGKIKGIGPAYWTKLLYFFTPIQNFYIMDQWTSKSINLLTGRQVVRMEGNVASGDNKCGNYQSYCEEVDVIADLLKLPGDDVEEMLMSSKGSSWRKHVKKEYDYNPDNLRNFYSHIPSQNF